MTAVISHRGPDDEGFLLVDSNGSGILCHSDETDEHCRFDSTHIDLFGGTAWMGFGFRRLSIIDLSPCGHQPMISADGSVAVVFNGEIYNHHEIRLQLEAKGYSFAGSSDTEVLLNAYIEYGVDCVSKFNGMWAFAIYDKINRRLFCSRDRLGVKPFYYSWRNREFLFASEIKQILENRNINRRANPQKVYEYFVLNEKSYGEETFFEGISSLLPGHNLIFDLDADVDKPFVIHKYWSLMNSNRCFGSRKEAKAIIEDLITSAVQLRLRSDVPLAACLSGGIDSNLVVYMMSRLMDMSGFDVFTTAYLDSNHRSDETKFSRMTVDQLGLRSHEVYPEKDTHLDELKKIIWHQEEPIASASMMAEWAIMRAINERGFKVVLGGQGGDEGFWGYNIQCVSYLLYLLNHLKINGFIRESSAMTKNGIIDAGYIGKNALYHFVPGLYKRKINAVASEYISQECIRENSTWMNDPWTHIKGSLTEKELMSVFITKNTLPANLHSEDRNSMAFSIESRAPFVDYRVLEIASSIPIQWHVEGGWTKSILRDILDGNISNEIVRRRIKIGFEAPQDQIMQREWGVVRDILTDSPRLRPILNQERIRRALNGPPNSHMWKLMCLEIWYNEFGLTV